MTPNMRKTPMSYNFCNVNQLKKRIMEMHLDIPVELDTSVLSQKVTINSSVPKALKNALTVHPMEGFDADASGTPGELTKRRYLRFAKGGAALIWFEAIAIVPEARTNQRQLMLTDENVDEYKKLIDQMRNAADGDICIIAQLTHSGRFSSPLPLIATHNAEIEAKRPLSPNIPLLTDEYLDTLPEHFAHSALLAKKAGFDGVDIKACHQYLLSELLSAFTRKGKYGGSYENRTRLFKDAIKAVKNAVGDSMILASRLNFADMILYPYGFGMKSDGSYEIDLTETKKLVGEIKDLGVSLIDMTLGSPYFNPHINRPHNIGEYTLPEHPLFGVERLLLCSKEIQSLYPDMTVIGTGYSYLKESAQFVAAGAIKNKYASLVGFGRMAFAYPNFANDILNGKFDKNKSCVTCGKCTKLMRSGCVCGCPIRDQEIYMPLYKQYVMKKTKGN